MQKTAIYGIIAAVVIAAGIGIAFGAMSMNDNTVEPTVANQQPVDDNQVRVIKHALGETEITGTAERVVVLEWSYAEQLLALGVQPVGVADIEGMNTWVNLKELSLSDSAVDVGLRWEPNLETIASLDPDLIIWTDFYKDKYDEMSEIAPTVMFNPYPTKEENVSELERMEQDFMEIADAVGKHDEGIAVLDRMNQKFEEAKAVVQASEAAGEPFALVMAYPYEDSVDMRISTHNGQASEIIERLGMENAWSVEYEQYGFSNIGLEDLTTVEDANFFYISGAEGDDMFAVTYRDNPVWKDMNFVEEGRVYPLGEDTWVYGGPISAELIAEKVVAAVSGEQTNTRTVKHAMGETEITGTPKRVIALEWIYAEDLLALGVQPVGVADIEEMNRWVNLKGLALDESVVEVGHRWEPNLEVMAQLEPDLIIGHVSNNEAIYEELSKLAPTLIFNPDTSQEGSVGQLEEMRQTFMTIADVVG